MGTSSANDRLLITLQGGATLNIEDPQGFTVRYDPTANDYQSDVPGLSAIREEIVDDEDDTTLVSSPVDLLSFGTPATGTYLLYVQSDQAQQVVLSAAPFNDQGQGSGGSDVLAIGAGEQATYQLAYSVSPTPIATLQRIRLASAETQHSPTRLTLRPLANPSRAACTVSYRGKPNRSLEVRIFDVRGRCLRVLALPATVGGDGEVRWDGRTDGGVPAPAGVYFIRVRQGDDHADARIVLLR